MTIRVDEDDMKVIDTDAKESIDLRQYPDEIEEDPKVQEFCERADEYDRSREKQGKLSALL